MEQTICQKCRPITRLRYMHMVRLRHSAVALHWWCTTDDRKRCRWHFASSHASYQAYADSVLWRFEILSGILDVTFLIKYCGLLGSGLYR